MLIVWGRANSSNVMKVLWLLDELELEHERRDAGGPFGVTNTAAYRQLNPMGLVPTVEEDGFALWESNAILRYLAATHAQGTPLWPADPRRRAVMDQWLDWQQTALGPPAGHLFFGLVRTPLEKRDPAALEAAAAETGRMWELLDGVLKRRDFVAGEAFSLADIALGVHAHRWFHYPIARPKLVALHSWYQRLLARPAYARRIATRPIT